MNDPKTINSYPADAADFDEMTQQPADELMEVEAAKLEQVAGGAGWLGHWAQLGI